jgi:hypothetical protein
MPTPEQRVLITEFWRNPFGPHGPALQRLLNAMRSAPAPGKYVVLRREPQCDWVLGRLGARGQAVQLLPKERFADLADAVRAVFARRWRERFGEDIE